MLTQLGEVLETNRETIKHVVSNTSGIVTTTIAHQRELAEFLDVAPMTLDNLYNIIDRRTVRSGCTCSPTRCCSTVRPIKEMCNMMGLRQLGCSTGTLQDFGPDFGV